MDFKKLASFIVIFGIVIVLYGGINWVNKQPVSHMDGLSWLTNQPVSPGKDGVRDNWESPYADTENRIRESRRKDAKKVMIGGAIVIFAGIAVFASAKKKD